MKALSPHFTQASGSMGGLMATNSKAGLVFGRKNGRVKSTSFRSSQARRRLAFLSQKWRSLSETQRMQWNEFDVAKSGFESYMAYNSRLRAYNDPLIDVPPVLVDMPITPCDVVLSRFNFFGNFQLQVGVFSAGTGWRGVFRATTPQSPGVTNPSVSAWREVGFFLTPFVGIAFPQIGGLYQQRVGISQSQVGSKVFVEYAIFNRSTGQITNPVRSFGIIEQQ